MTDLIDGLESVAFPAILAVDRAQSALSAREFPKTSFIPRCARAEPLASERWYSLVDAATYDQGSATSLQTYMQTTRIILRSSAAFFASQVDDLNWAMDFVGESPCTTDLVVRARDESGCATRAFLSASEADDPVGALTDVLALWASEGQQSHSDGKTSAGARRFQTAAPVESDAPPSDLLIQVLKRWNSASIKARVDVTARSEPVPRYAVQILTASFSEVARWRVHDVPARWGAWADQDIAHAFLSQSSQCQFAMQIRHPGESRQEDSFVLLWDAATSTGPNTQHFGPIVLASDHLNSADTCAAARYTGYLDRYCLRFLTTRGQWLTPLMSGLPASHRSNDGWALNTRGQALLGENRPSEALQFFTEALEVSRVAIDDHGIIAALTGIADAARRLGQIEDAVLAEKELATFLTPSR